AASQEVTRRNLGKESCPVLDRVCGLAFALALRDARVQSSPASLCPGLDSRQLRTRRVIGLDHLAVKVWECRRACASTRVSEGNSFFYVCVCVCVCVCV